MESYSTWLKRNNIKVLDEARLPADITRARNILDLMEKEWKANNKEAYNHLSNALYSLSNSTEFSKHIDKYKNVAKK